MIRLGHIDFSNCVPVHALLLGDDRPAGIDVVAGVPSELNRMLAAREIDVAPCSSIEYARHPEYRLLPDFCIAARHAVRSILFETAAPPQELDGRKVALPTASATSVVLLRALLEQHHRVRPEYVWFDQAREDPFAGGAAAALWIGDGALLRRTDRPRIDLGSAWREWTGLPFVFALWQTSAGPELDGELARLHGLLEESLSWAEANPDELAARHARHFHVDAATLAQYWAGLTYRLDAPTLAGLERFYAHAAELGEAPVAPALRWVATGGY